MLNSSAVERGTEHGGSACCDLVVVDRICIFVCALVHGSQVQSQPACGVAQGPGLWGWEVRELLRWAGAGEAEVGEKGSGCVRKQQTSSGEMK